MTISHKEASLAERRARVVSKGLMTPRLEVQAASGSMIVDGDGRKLIDFAGGIGCQNLGHGNPAVVAAIERQIHQYLHQCFTVGAYEPYVEVCERLAASSPCTGDEQRSALFNAGAEAVENSVKIARAATGRSGVVVFDRAFHGRTFMTMAMTGSVKYKQGFGPFPPEVYRAPAPYPYRGVSTEDAIAGFKEVFASQVDPRDVACVVLETFQGEGGFIPFDPAFLQAVRELTAKHGIVFVADEIQAGIGRTGTPWAIDRYEVQPDLIIAGKSLGGGLPLASVTGNAEFMDACAPGTLGSTFGGNPVACAAATVVLDQIATDEFRKQATALEETLATTLDRIVANNATVGEHRGLGTMRAIEFLDPTPDLSRAVVSAAYDQGLLVVACGHNGNVLRLLPALTIDQDELHAGLSILEEIIAGHPVAR